MTKIENDYFSGVSAEYGRFRPRYPPGLFAYLARLAPARGCAWDCGTGSGQAAAALAGYFGRVIATDLSYDQIRNAEPHPRVSYVAATAEAVPLVDRCVDLVAVAQALHWFRLESCYAEVGRLLRPGGVVAVWTYNLMEVTPAVDRLLRLLYRDILDGFWPPERCMVESAYADLPFPFTPLPKRDFLMTAEWSFPRFLGYLGTWSAVQLFRHKTGKDPREQIRRGLERAWGAARTRTVRWPMALRLGRVASSA